MADDTDINALCARLRDRGDEDSLLAAAMILDLETNYRRLEALWSRVPLEQRHRAVGVDV